MFIHSPLIGFYIERNNDKAAVDTCFYSLLCKSDGFRSADSAKIAHDRNLFAGSIAAYCIDNCSVQFKLFIGSHGSPFTGGTTNQNSFGAMFYQVFCKCHGTFIIDFTISGKWCDHCSYNTPKFCISHFLLLSFNILLVKRHT